MYLCICLCVCQSVCLSINSLLPDINPRLTTLHAMSPTEEMYICGHIAYEVWLSVTLRQG